MNNSYWDINDFLSEEEKVVGKFNFDSIDNGELDLSQNHSKDIKKE